MSRVRTVILGTGPVAISLARRLRSIPSGLALAAVTDVTSEAAIAPDLFGADVAVVRGGSRGLLNWTGFKDIGIIFDTAMAMSGEERDAMRRAGKRLIDLTPSEIGLPAVPAVNLAECVDASCVNLTTAGGQAAAPIVAALSQVVKVHYGEAVISMASKSADSGMRDRIDELTRATARSLETVGGARQGKAVVLLNPAEPPLKMRATVLVLSEVSDRETIRASVAGMVQAVRSYLPGYRLLQEMQFETIGNNVPVKIPGLGVFSGLKTTVLLEIDATADGLPGYAGGLDLLTSSAVAIADSIASQRT